MPFFMALASCSLQGEHAGFLPDSSHSLVEQLMAGASQRGRIKSHGYRLSARCFGGK